MKPEELDQLIETLTGIRAGKAWQFTAGTLWIDADGDTCPLGCARLHHKIRLKPWTLPPPPEGKQWHRGAEFTEADLPEGYRPMLVGETAIDGDEFLPYKEGTPVFWLTRTTGINVNCNIWLDSEAISKHRTKRPLPDPYAEPRAAHKAGKVIQIWDGAEWETLPSPNFNSPIGKYRIKPNPVPLCKDDIPTGSGLRNLKFYPDMAWVGISRVGVNGVATANGVFYSYETLAAEGSAWEIQRPGQSWQPCSKEAPAP